MSSIHHVLLPRAAGTYLSPLSAFKTRQVSRAFDKGVTRWIGTLPQTVFCRVLEAPSPAPLLERISRELTGLQEAELVSNREELWSAELMSATQAMLRSHAPTLRKLKLDLPVALELRDCGVFAALESLEVDEDNLCCLLVHRLANDGAHAAFPRCCSLRVLPTRNDRLPSFYGEYTFLGGKKSDVDRVRASLLHHFPVLEDFVSESSRPWCVPEAVGGGDSRLRRVAIKHCNRLPQGAFVQLSKLPLSVTEVVMFGDFRPRTMQDPWPPLLSLLEARPDLHLRVVADGSAFDLPRFDSLPAAQRSRLHVSSAAVDCFGTLPATWQSAAAFINHAAADGNTAGITWPSDVAAELQGCPLRLQVDVDRSVPDLPTPLVLRGVASLNAEIWFTGDAQSVSSPLPSNMHLPDLRQVSVGVYAGQAQLFLSATLGDKSAEQSPPAGSLMSGVTQGRRVECLKVTDLVAHNSAALTWLLGRTEGLHGAITHVCLDALDQSRMEAIRVAGELLSNVATLELKPGKSTDLQAWARVVDVVRSLRGLRTVQLSGDMSEETVQRMRAALVDADVADTVELQIV